MAVLIFLRYGTDGFTCEDVRRLPGLKKFACPRLRSWKDDGIIRATKVKLPGSYKEVNLWKFTSSAIASLSKLI